MFHLLEKAFAIAALVQSDETAVPRTWPARKSPLFDFVSVFVLSFGPFTRDGGGGDPMAKHAVDWMLAILAGVLGGGVTYPQEGKEGRQTPASGTSARTPLVRLWEEGVPVQVRVPVATDSHEVMSAIAFPESGIQAAITGWGQNTLTAIQKGSFLFLRLSRKSEGQLSVIGESGTHYLLYLEAVDPQDPERYDAYVKIVRPSAKSPAGEGKLSAPAPDRGKPKGALELVRAMRMGEPREGARVLRAKGETLYSGYDIELRLLFVYEESSMIGRIYEVRNLSGRKLALDASRFRAAQDVLILSGLRENVIPPGGVSRLYTVFWRP
jgi:hypothetical protein